MSLGSKTTSFKSILLAIFVSLFISCNSDGQTRRLKFSTGSESTPEILVEVASTASSREIGLMYRKSMDEKRGMLFIFEDERPRSFWMKNTHIPLDMIFVDANHVVVKVIHNTEPYTTSPYLSEKPAKFVVEVNAGKAKEWGIIEGSLLVLIDSSF
jgi:uncharacterized membrane protein (UPF0127 family)